jgi:tetratricopeptide (TPR) repeat protein
MRDPLLPDHLRIAIAYQRSISLRFKGDHDQSDAVMRDISKNVSVGSSDIRVHCAYGRLQLSRTENAIMREEFDKANSYLASWEVKNPSPSGLELKVVRLKITVLGRLSRYEGNFHHACHCLQECLKFIPENTSRYHIMHHLADVYCELNAPEQAEELVQAEVQRLRASGKQRSRNFRRLALPLAEAYTKQKRGKEAGSLFGELNQLFQRMDSLDVSDQLGHVRSMIGLARINHHEGRWSEARNILETALCLTEKYKTFIKGGFYTGFIYLFLSVISFQLGDDSTALNSLELANRIGDRRAKQYFIPGLGTYFMRDLELSLSRLSTVRLCSMYINSSEPLPSALQIPRDQSGVNRQAGVR